MTRDSSADERLFTIATRNRLLAADLLESLQPQQWQTPSLCQGWTVREVAAHLVPSSASSLRLAADVIRHRGNFDNLADEAARRGAQRPTADIVRDLRERASQRLRPPGIGAAGPMTDTVVHLRDMSLPLGSPTTADPESWRAALDFLVSRAAGRGFVAKERLVGLRLEAADQDWRWGDGSASVTGSLEALAMTVAARTSHLAELSGPGVALLRERLAQH